MMKLNIGCGRDYKEGWWNCDLSEEVKVDALLDIRTAVLPFKENSCEHIYISGVLEQVGSNEALIHILNECHRVLAPGKNIQIVVPNARHAIAHRDPMDIRKFTAGTFNYFISGMREHELYGSVYGFKGWKGIDISENQRHIFVVTMVK